MRRSPLIPFALLLGAVIAQGGAAQTTATFSRFDFNNAYRIDREDAFPNARTKNGNVAGDMLYKAFPVDVLARHEAIRVSGVRIAFRIGSSYKGSFPVSVAFPDVAFFPLIPRSIGGKTFDVPDRTRKHTRTLKLGTVSVVRGEIQTHVVRLKTPVVLSSRDLRRRFQGWAVALMAPPGEALGTGKARFVAVSSFGEVHRLGGRSTFSGAWNEATQTFLPFGTRGAPSNNGELSVQLLLDQPTLQVFSDAAGGVRADPRHIETQVGPGAYLNGLASAVRPGFFGLFCQWDGHDKDGQWAFPVLAAIGPTMPTGLLRIGGATMIRDLASSAGALAFVQTGSFGPLGRYKARGTAGHRQDLSGVFVTKRLAVPRSPALRGLTLWVQVVLGNPSTSVFSAATNLVRIEF